MAYQKAPMEQIPQPINTGICIPGRLFINKEEELENCKKYVFFKNSLKIH